MRCVSVLQFAPVRASCNDTFGMLLTCYITAILITQGYYGTFRGDFSIFETLILTQTLTNSANLVQLGEVKCICSWPYWKMAAILDFRFTNLTEYLTTIEMYYANIGACITICTIYPKNANYLLHCKSVTYNMPNGNVTPTSHRPRNL